MVQLQEAATLDYRSETYRDAYSRINAIVIEGELEANHNYLALATMLPEGAADLNKLARMESKHMKGFEACARNLEVTPDKDFAVKFFTPLRENFEAAQKSGDLITCLVIQSLLIECFAIAAYNVYIPVADDFARKVTEGVVKDEYLHLNYGETWLRGHFEDPSVKEQIGVANAANLPLIWQMFKQVEADADTLGMDPEAVLEDFMIAYSEALENVGFTNREVMRLAAQGLRSL